MMVFGDEWFGSEKIRKVEHDGLLLILYMIVMN